MENTYKQLEESVNKIIETAKIIHGSTETLADSQYREIIEDMIVIMHKMNVVVKEQQKVIKALEYKEYRSRFES